VGVEAVVVALLVLLAVACVLLDNKRRSGTWLTRRQLRSAVGKTLENPSPTYQLSPADRDAWTGGAGL
jgi:hypothetical protein